MEGKRSPAIECRWNGLTFTELSSNWLALEPGIWKTKCQDSPVTFNCAIHWNTQHLLQTAVVIAVSQGFAIGTLNSDSGKHNASIWLKNRVKSYIIKETDWFETKYLIIARWL